MSKKIKTEIKVTVIDPNSKKESKAVLKQIVVEKLQLLDKNQLLFHT